MGDPPATCSAASSVGTAPRPGLPVCPLERTWLRQEAMAPSPPSAASTVTRIAGVCGDQASSSARDHSARTQVPGIARAASAASSATSSAPLWP